MAAHRWWRVYCIASGDSNGYYSCTEIQLRTAIGGANVVSGGTASSLGTIFSGTAAQAWDGTTATQFIINGYGTGGAAFIYDFGAGNAKDIVEVGWGGRSDGFFYQSPCAGELQYSDDGATWTKLFGWSVPAWGFASEMRFFTGSTPSTCFDWNFRTATVSLPTSNRLKASFSAVSAIGVNRPSYGLAYSEFTITTLTGTPAVGLIGEAYAFPASLLGADALSLGYRSTGAVVSNGTTLATLATFAQGDRVDVAHDSFNQLVWFRVNGGNWNNSAGNDPAALVGGIAVPNTSGSTNVTASTRFAAGASITGTVIDGQFDTFVGTPPTGYGAIASFTLKPTTAGKPLYSIVPSGYNPGTVTARSNKKLANDNELLRYYNGSTPITYVSGTVKENSVLVAGRVVEVYDRNTGELLGRTTSAADGTWSIPCMGRPAVRVVGSDPTTYNSQVFDNVVPS
jgi:hypothetical protein